MGLALSISCANQVASPAAPGVTSNAAVRDDASFFRQFTQTDPLDSYVLLPNADEFTTGRLDGSEAHRPVIRVRLNSIAMGSLRDGKLAAGATFADGSIVVKEIRSSASGTPNLYAVMLKDSRNSLAGDGWLWAEYGPSGSVTFSVSNRGSACTSCHRRQQGPRNDLVRSFESNNRTIQVFAIADHGIEAAQFVRLSAMQGMGPSRVAGGSAFEFYSLAGLSTA